MAKRDKNRSYMDWEYEWMESARKIEEKKERREQRMKKHEYDMSWETEDNGETC